jgi:hypothetical protein
MALPLIIKAAALGGAAYFASRWLSTQNRQRRARGDVTSSRTELPAYGDSHAMSAPSVARESLGESAASPFPSSGPTA